ncbi:MAG: class I SAM-dependent methyltransferase [Candidatus Binatia bacterium]|nr:class I SAM-dependent methyltransferase [Candidatus Binatia bacterium]
MQFWRFLIPPALGFTLRNGGHMLYDRVTGAPPIPLRVRDYLAEHAASGDPADVLRLMDRFAREERFLMNVGPDKGPLVREVLDKLPEQARILELGAFCGYSSILLAVTLGPAGRIVSVEKSRSATEATRANIELAGLSDRIEVIHGASTEQIPTLQGPFHLVFLDHWKDLYRGDLELLEKSGQLRPGSIVVADNVGEVFGAADYLEYVRNCGRYDSENRPATIEYTQIPDAVEISVYRGP